MVQVLDEISDEKLRELYRQSYYEGENEFVYEDYLGKSNHKVRDFESRLDSICTRNGIERPGACLEIGCAFGLFLDVARRRGWRTQGIELSTHAAQHAREHLGLNVSSESDALRQVPSTSQDLVVMWDVIEHLKEPLEVLREIRRVLTPEGVFVLSTGDVGSLGARLYGRRWHLIKPPYHLFYFDRNTIRAMLEEVGFAIGDIRNDGHPLDNHGKPWLPAWIAARDKYVGWRLDSGPIMVVTALLTKHNAIAL